MNLAERVALAKNQPTVASVHVNRPLTNVSVAFTQSQSDFVAATVFPIVNVNKQSDLFFVYSKADWLRIEAERRAPATESAGGGYRLNTQSYFAHKYAFHKDVDEDMRANADSGVDPDRDATEFVTQNLLMLREEMFVSQFFGTGIWTTELQGITGAPGAGQFQFWNESGSTPITDVKTGVTAVKRLTGRRPTDLTIHPDVMDVLSEHADIKDVIKYTQTGIVTAELLARVFGIQRVNVLDAISNTGPEEGTEATDFIATEPDAMLTFAPPRPSLLMPSAGYTFAWTGLLGAGAFATRMKRFEMKALEAVRVEGEMAWDQNLVSADLGFFFDDAIDPA